jgi:hypothetical protein
MKTYVRLYHLAQFLLEWEVFQTNSFRENENTNFRSIVDGSGLPICVAMFPVHASPFSHEIFVWNFSKYYLLEALHAARIQLFVIVVCLKSRHISRFKWRSENIFSLSILCTIRKRVLVIYVCGIFPSLPFFWGGGGGFLHLHFEEGRYNIRPTKLT